MENLKIKCSECKNEYDPTLFVSSYNAKKYKNCYECRKNYIYTRDKELAMKGLRYCNSCKKEQNVDNFFSKKLNKYMAYCFDCRKSYVESLDK